MRRIPLFVVVLAGVLSLMAGSAVAAAVRTAASPPVNGSLPTIAGTAQQGHTLMASNGSWGGVTPIAYAYQWQRCNSSGSSCGSINHATNQNYVASSGDVGRTIRVEVTATNADGTSQALSGPTAVIAGLNHGSWSGSQPITFTYQWQSCTAVTGVCTNIAGATGSKYLIGASQVGTRLRAVVTATNSVGKTSAFSNVTAVVLAKASAPVNTSLPVISGTPSVGQTLQASTGVWSGVATNGFSYQWSRCNANGSACANISGATGQSYGVGQADLRLALRVTVTATNPTGSTSAASAAVLIAPKPVLTARFTAVLRAGQEVSRPNGPMTRAVGHFTAKVTGKTLSWTLTFSHLTGRPTVARLNKGVRGTNGPAFKVLCRTCLSPTHGTLTLTASQLAAMLRGGTYVNIHTAKNTRGEIRGQINRVS
jgi:hypothetical protein